MASFDSDGVRISFIDEGEGDPILLIHGFASNVAKNWIGPGWVRTLTQAGRRVIAVGTTVVRALETVADDSGRVRGGGGWTDLVLGPGRPARVVTGLITGLHLPESSHLLLLEAVAGAGIVRRAYDAALERRYLWHEFGDSMLLMP